MHDLKYSKKYPAALWHSSIYTCRYIKIASHTNFIEMIGNFWSDKCAVVAEGFFLNNDIAGPVARIKDA